MQTGNEGNEQAFEFGLRPGEPADLDFIVDSWRRSYDDAPNTRCPGGLPEYIATQRQVIEQCLKTSSVLVAYPRAPEEDTWQILGWVCFRKGPRSLTVLHYVYVKPSWRRKEERVGTALLRAALEPLPTTLFTTHIPKPDAPVQALYDMAGACGVVLRFNPALIFAPPPGTIVET
jgi:hypothetical protein